MLLAIALGETVYWVHRCRRLIILSPLTGIAISVGVMVVRNWHYLRQFTPHR